MSRLPERGELWIAAVVVLCVAAALLFLRRDPPVGPGILPPRVDSALVAERARARVLDSVSAAAIHEEQQARLYIATLERQAATARASAAQSARRADHLAQTARAAGDTVSLAWSAYEAADARGDSLAHVVTVQDTVIATLQLGVTRWRTAFDTADAQRVRLLALTTDLREAVDRAARQNRCRIAGLVPCPSRTTVGVVGLAAGAVGALYLTR
jgi:hypothetical protein